MRSRRLGIAYEVGGRMIEATTVRDILAGRTGLLAERARRLQVAPMAAPAGIEERLLAALLAGGAAAWQRVGDLQSADFADVEHRALYRAIAAELGRRLPLDPHRLYSEFCAALGRVHVQSIHRDVIERWQLAVKPAEAPELVAQLAPLVKQAAAEREAKRAADPRRVTAEEAWARWGDPRSWSSPAPASPPRVPTSGWAGLEVVEKA